MYGLVSLCSVYVKELLYVQIVCRSVLVDFVQYGMHGNKGMHGFFGLSILSHCAGVNILADYVQECS